MKAGRTGGLLVLMLFYALQGCSAQRAPASLKFSKEAVELGRIAVGQLGVADIRVTNISREPIVMGPIQTTCSCIKAGISPDRLEPGQTGTLNIRVETGLPEGFLDGAVKLSFTKQNKNREECYLPVRLQSYALVLTDPVLADFGKVKRGEVAKMEVKVRLPKSDLPFSDRIRITSSDSSLLWRIKPGESLLELSLDTSNIPTGHYKSELCINTLFEGKWTESAWNLPLVAKIQGDIQLRPSSLYLGSTHPSQVISSDITFQAKNSGNLKLVSIKGVGLLVQNYEWVKKDPANYLLTVKTMAPVKPGPFVGRLICRFTGTSGSEDVAVGVLGAVVK